MTTRPERWPKDTKRPWTPEDDTFLVSTHATHTITQQAQALRRSYAAVSARRQILGQDGLISPYHRKMRRLVSEDERQYIIERIRAGARGERVARSVGRNLTAVSRIVRPLGGFRTVRATPESRVWTPVELAELFNRAHTTILYWIDTGVIPARRRKASMKQRRWNLITDSMLLRFIEDRRHWSRWNPDELTDPDWKWYATRIRKER